MPPMVRTILGILLILAGAWIFATGWSRRDSIMGSLAETGTRIANAFDGGARTPRHYVSMAGGAVLALGGAVLVFTGGRRS